MTVELAALALTALPPLCQVDNNPFSFLANPTNGLPIAPFTGDPQDEHLLGSVGARPSDENAMHPAHLKLRTTSTFTALRGAAMASLGCAPKPINSVCAGCVSLCMLCLMKYMGHANTRNILR